MMTIIEVDGVNHEQLRVDSIHIFAGQRYSVVVKANQPVSNYWVRAKPNIGPTTFGGGLNSAILHYKGADMKDPQSISILSNPLNETDLCPLDNPGAPGGCDPADISYYLDIQFVKGKNMYTVNDVVFIPPTVPVLLQILSGAQSAKDILPEGSVYTIQPNKTVELIISGGVAGSPHPFHLHGHKFDVIRSAGSTAYDYKNPVRRDVVNTGVDGDNVTIRFKTDNPGPWFLH
ncbi:laccase, partial [Termitomyces sp. T159_Od127]